ncbi:uncharacterized protein LOC134280370 [Saccostrea cucullata]|uniref:uncharacterized protein LOC134280370 n=1 Tax=Saccostrea cuccullata TaxID=36930 RepID=UPI002ECFE12E
MASKLLSTDQENFIHLGQVCIDLLKIILKDILKIHIESKKLYAAISSCPTLTTGKYQIRSDQKKICFIPPPSVPDYEKFDVSLLYALIRNLCPSLKPTQGWGKDPTSTDIQIGDDIERLRLFRNGMFAHLDSTAVPDTEFTTAWNNLKIIIPRTQAFVRSNGISADYERELENIERSDFGLSDMEKYKTLLEGILCILKRQENEEFPRIAINGEDKVVCGKMVLLEAKVQHPSKSLTCTIIWQRVRHNGTERIVTSEEKYKDSTSRELVIQKVSKEDEGEYQAVIPWVMDGQTHNITSNTIFLRPLGEKPTLEKLNVNTGTVGITLNYKYKVSQDSPEVDHIAWTRNGDALNIDQIKYVGGGLLDTYFSITSPTCEDRGTYTCIVGNAVGNIAESLLLDFPNATISTENFVVYGNETRIDSKLISCPPCERVVWQKSSDLLSRPNIISCSPVTNRTKKSVSLRCDVFPPENSPPLNEIVWMKNDKIIDIAQSGGKYIGGTIKDATLVINDVNEHDAGSFQCRASNALGSTLGKVIVLSVPEIQIQREERTETNTLHFTASIESFPAAFSVHWSKKNKDKDEYTPIDVNEEECRGTSNSLPHPLLVTTQRNLICKSFKIEARNFIGASTKYIPDDSSSPSCNMSDNKENRLNDIYKKKGSTIRFNNLHNVLIREIPEERLKSLKRSLKVVSSRDVSVENIATVEDFFTTLYDEGIFKEQDVIMMQYLLRNIERPDLELKCVEYARNNKQCYFEESKPAETGFKHVQLHVEKDFKNFTDMEMDNIVDTVAAIVGCDKSCIELVSVRPNRSFIIVLSMKAKFARILEQKGSFGLTRLLTYNVDWIKVGNNTINIARETHQKHALVDSTYMSKEETINACRACRLLLGPCTDQLRDVLRHHVPPQHIAREITNLPRLSAPQMNLILPSGSSYTGNYDDMDIPLLYILLRNICSIPPHSNGWGNDPDPTDRSLSANIERIRIARNQCVHSSTPALSNADFYTVWAIARSAVVDLDTFLSNGKKFEKEVDFLRYETIDPVRDYKEELRKQSEEDVKTWEITQGLKRKYAY